MDNLSLQLVSEAQRRVHENLQSVAIKTEAQVTPGLALALEGGGG